MNPGPPSGGRGRKATGRHSMTVRAVRGAIKVTEDSPSCVLDATERLVRALLEANSASGGDLISMLFTVTDDIRSTFPAEAVRRMGLGAVPLM